MNYNFFLPVHFLNSPEKSRNLSWSSWKGSINPTFYSDHVRHGKSEREDLRLWNNRKRYLEPIFLLLIISYFFQLKLLLVGSTQHIDIHSPHRKSTFQLTSIYEWYEWSRIGTKNYLIFFFENTSHMMTVVYRNRDKNTVTTSL